MKSLSFSVAALALMASSGTAFAAGESGRVISTKRTVTSSRVPIASPAVSSAAQNSSWYGSLNAPGGLAGYQTPVAGFVLPPYWMQANFYIEDYARYGFAAPKDGFGWSRYYEDAVLTDSTGRVVDVVKDVDWNRFDNGQFANGSGVSFPEGTVPGAGIPSTGFPSTGFPSAGVDPRDIEPERESGGGIGGVGGALIGGAVGAVAGNLIGGRGERLAGSLIGGGVGALAGLAVGESVRDGKKRKRLSRRDRRRGRGGPHWDNGYYGGGYYNETYTTVNYIPVEPISTTTTTTQVIEDSVPVAATPRRRVFKPRARVKRVARPRPRCQCRT